MRLPPLRPRLPMDGLTRRTMLKASGVLGASALLAGAASVTWEQVMGRAVTTPLAGGTPILVLVTMYGGNDGLNTLIPYTDPAYHDARPELAYTAGEVLALDGQFGLNPGLKSLASMWQEKKLAVVRGVGYPKPDHSHFRSMDIWQTGSPDSPVSSGWIGRWLDVSGGDPLLALNIGGVLPPLAVGTSCSAAALSLTPAKPGAREAIFAKLALADAGDSRAGAQVAASYAAVGRVGATFGPVVAGGGAPAAGAAKAATLSDELALVAKCVRAGVPTRVYSVSISGFDTHADEKISQTAQLGALDRALGEFRAGMAGHPRAKDVVVVAYSEFGRRVKANASQGTDHGTAGPMFVIGDMVKSGFYGEQPSLTDLDGGDLKVSTDFRCVYGELLSSVLGTDPARVLDKPKPALGFLT